MATPTAQPATSAKPATALTPGTGAQAATSEQRQAAERFYRGKTLRIVVGSGAGGGFDMTARLVSKHIGKYIPGGPQVVVENMPGGGGLVAANYMYNIAPKDGTVIGIFHEAQMMNQVTKADGVNFDLRKFEWLGSSFNDPNVCLLRTDAPARTFQEMIGNQSPITVGGTGPGSNTYDAPRVVAAATGANLKVVGGYPSTNDVRVGVERGELHGMCLGWESVKSASYQWLKDGFAKVVVQNGMKSHPDLADVPLAIEFAKDEESKTLLRLVDAPAAMAKPFALPPGVEPARVEVLREALQATYRDPAFLEEAGNMRLEFSPKIHTEIQDILSEVLNTPVAAVQRYKEIIQ